MKEIIDLLRKYDVSMTIDPRRPGTIDQVVISLRKDTKANIHRMDYTIDYLRRTRYIEAIDELIPRLIVDFAEEVKIKEGMAGGGFKITNIDVLPCICEDHCYPVERYDTLRRGEVEWTRLWLECPSCHALSIPSTDFSASVMDWNDMNKVDGVRQRDENAR